ncbi:protein Churchill-like isoform X2 [Halichondria panicea]|uniref:protein Churchill-like isoform X2 n=1 Tax=Halichondria panicea TaxID=6063 RepID=UPI00312BB354
MCVKCWKQRMPDRGTTCLEKGAYLMNYVGCHQCQARASIGEKDQTKQEEENGDEVITFTHVCTECEHEIAAHTYQFSIEEEFQEYSMECNLCGHGEATVSILPNDPREQQLF